MGETPTHLNLSGHFKRLVYVLGQPVELELAHATRLVITVMTN